MTKKKSLKNNKKKKLTWAGMRTYALNPHPYERILKQKEILLFSANGPTELVSQSEFLATFFSYKTTHNLELRTGNHRRLI